VLLEAPARLGGGSSIDFSSTIQKRLIAHRSSPDSAAAAAIHTSTCIRHSVFIIKLTWIVSPGKPANDDSALYDNKQEAQLPQR